MFEISLLGNITLVFIVIFLFLFLLYKYQKLINKSNYMIFVLRIASLIILFLLILNPKVNWTVKIPSNKSLNLYIDNSISMIDNLNSEGIDFNNLYQTLKVKLDSMDIDNEVYIFGDSIRSINSAILFTDSSSFSNDLFKHMFSNNSDYSLLVTDGHINGHNEELLSNSRLFVVGVGLDSLANDLSIESILIPNQITDDGNVDVSIKIKYDIDTNYKGFCNVTNNDIVNQMPIKIPIGVGFYKFKFPINVKDLGEYAYFEISKHELENNINNNRYFIDFNFMNSQEVLFISGTLSKNTDFLKNYLDNQKVKYNHIYRIYNEELAIDFDDFNYDLVILDGFPFTKSDIYLANKIVLNSKTVYFQNSINNNSSILFLSDQFNISALPNDDLVHKKIYKSFESPFLDNLKINDIPYMASNYSYFGNSLAQVLYSDSSTVISKNNNDYAVLINDIDAYSLKEFNVNGSTNLDKLIDNLIYYLTNEEQMLVLEVEDYTHNVYEDVIFDIKYNDVLQGSNIVLFTISESDTTMYDISSNIVDSLEYAMSFNNSGVNQVYTTIELSDGSVATSNSVFLDIKDINSESASFNENKSLLTKLAFENKGEYYSINQISAVFEKIDSRKSIINSDYDLDVLTFQYYWLLLILLFSIEWFFRKRYGLL